jgi:hypothetical protein
MGVEKLSYTYEKILSLADSCGSNHTGFFGGSHKGGYELQQVPSECAALIYDLQKYKINNYLEVGVCSGGLTRLMCDVLDIENIFLMDLQITPYPHCIDLPEVYDKNMKGMRRRGFISQFWGDSHSKGAYEWLARQNTVFDYIFIDGDHAYDGVVKDINLTVDFLKSGGVMGFHDTIAVPEVKAAVDEIRGGRIPKLKLLSHYGTRFGITTFIKD